MSVDHKSRNNFVTLETPGDLVVGYRWKGWVGHGGLWKDLGLVDLLL